MKSYAYDLVDRLVAFAVMILEASEHLEIGLGARSLAKQIVRSGTSPALNYGEVQGAESPKDFLHKLKICLKELRETQICLKIIRLKPYLSSQVVDPLYDECNQLVAIFVASIETKKRNMGVN
jgi:four helix bundle protein